MQVTDAVYALGHSQEEVQRLIDQSRLMNDLTEHVFAKAGIQRGMRVLDVGCGGGDVSFLAARLVGPTGSVVGVDCSREALAAARKRTASLGLRNVTFVEGDVRALSVNATFDAAVGRLVLMYVGDPVSTVRGISGHVRPGGTIVFQEMDLAGAKASPASPLADKAIFWIRETLRRSLADLEMGLKLRQTLLMAGLPEPQMTLGARVEGGPNARAYEYTAATVRSLLPAMENYGVASAQEVQIDTLAARLRDELVASGGVLVLPPLVGAWSCRPC
jgi:ubiquinone/menaquinone biosynthesis C-methylase UbiE